MSSSLVSSAFSTPAQSADAGHPKLAAQDIKEIKTHASRHVQFWAVVYNETVTFSRMSEDAESVVYLSPSLVLGGPVLRQKRPCIPYYAPTAKRAELANASLPNIPLVPLHPQLQIYFHRMQSILSNTCHPLEIRAETRSIVSSILSRNNTEDRALAIVLWVKALYLAGGAVIEYSRTVAILAHDIVTELKCKSSKSAEKFEDELVFYVKRVFQMTWDKVSVTLHSLLGETNAMPTSPRLTFSDSQMVQASKNLTLS